MRAADPEAVRELVEQARDAAWGDVEANLQRRLRVEGMRADVDPDYDMMRAARMQSLRLVDLPRLVGPPAQARRGRGAAGRGGAGCSSGGIRGSRSPTRVAWPQSEPHPMRFPPDHPLVERVRAMCMRIPRGGRGRSPTVAARSGPASGSSPSSGVVRRHGAVVFIPDPTRAARAPRARRRVRPAVRGRVRVARDPRGCGIRGDGICSRSCSTRRTDASRSCVSCARWMPTRSCPRRSEPRFAPERERGVFWTLVCSRERPCARSSMDRASDYGSEGWEFESLRAHTVLRQ